MTVLFKNSKAFFLVCERGGLRVRFCLECGGA